MPGRRTHGAAAARGTQAVPAVGTQPAAIRVRPLLAATRVWALPAAIPMRALLAALGLATAWLAAGGFGALGFGPATASAQASAGKTSGALQAALRAARPSDTHTVWVRFSDKGAALAQALSLARASSSPRALSRRARRGRVAGLAFEDLPLQAEYVRAIEQRVLRLRQQSRWFNAVSATATADQIRALEALPFVAGVDLVRRFRRAPVEPLLEAPAAGSHASRATAVGLSYGTSLEQLQQLGVPAVHERGLSGAGVVVAVFDAGFDNLGHEAFAGMRILAQHDFVNGDGDVGDGADRGEGSHGTATLSVLGGFREGELIGPAFGAGFVLAKTEDTESETPVEEDNWAAAAEWAEALGADVISSSLTYLDFDPGSAGYTWAEMNGATALSTRAAELAAARGVVVVNSAGNAGFNPEHNTLGAPADGSHVLAVAAVSSTGARASFSSVGPSADGRIKPDVAAQGQLVKLAGPVANQYRLGNGTSFSCPLTAGVAALVLEAHPDYTADEVLSVLRLSARSAGQPDNLLGYGIVDAVAAIDAPRPQP